MEELVEGRDEVEKLEIERKEVSQKVDGVNTRLAGQQVFRASNPTKFGLRAKLPSQPPGFSTTQNGLVSNSIRFFAILGIVHFSTHS